MIASQFIFTPSQPDRMKSIVPDTYRDGAHILTGALFISFSSIWVAWSQVDPVVSAFYRVFFGSLFLLLYCLSTKAIRPISTRTTIYCVLCGLCFAGDLYCWHLSILYVGPGLATILGNFQVFVLTIISVLFFGQRLRVVFILALLLAFLGLFLIIGINWEVLSDDYRLGLLFGLITALFYACFILSLRKIQGLEPTISFIYTLLLISVATAAILGPLVWLSGTSFAIPSIGSLLSLACLGLFSQTVGWAFIARSLPNLLPSLAGLILLLQPALAFLWDVLIFARPTSMIQWGGVGVVLAAIYLGASSTRNKD
jgi:drug/metabolite transporter (DMT)-like permease